jgi:acetamidase/formamidase
MATAVLAALFPAVCLLAYAPATLAAGKTHALPKKGADGEVAGTAIEMDATVKVQVSVIKVTKRSAR